MTGTKIGSGFLCVCLNAGLALALAGCGGGDGAEVAQNPAAAPPAASNTAPKITGSAPTSIQAGTAYTFTPSATDAENDKVTFVVANKPAWATFDAATGKLTGTPTASHVGKYAGIEISATDGTAVTPLPAFSITVTAASTALAKAVTLEWQAPTENTDGTTLADLKGYEIHIGTTSQSYSQSIQVTNPSITRYVVETLTPGKYYFAITARNGAGFTSPLSNEVTTTLN